MKDDNIIREKSLDFGIRIVKFVRYILRQVTYAEHPICSQLLKAGTSIGANVRESTDAESREDFIHKLKIALKEANETDYWLDIFLGAEYMEQAHYESLKNDCDEIRKILTAIINTTRNNLK